MTHEQPGLRTDRYDLQRLAEQWIYQQPEPPTKDQVARRLGVTVERIWQVFDGSSDVFVLCGNYVWLTARARARLAGEPGEVARYWGIFRDRRGGWLHCPVVGVLLGPFSAEALRELSCLIEDAGKDPTRRVSLCDGLRQSAGLLEQEAQADRDELAAFRDRMAGVTNASLVGVLSFGGADVVEVGDEPDITVRSAD